MDGAKRARDDIAARLRDEIVAGRHRGPGGLKLVPLADHLKVSVTPVREALAILERRGLVVGRPHRGYEVVELGLDDIREVYELHARLLRSVVERATRHADLEFLRVLGELDDRILGALAEGDVAAAAAANHEFYRQINDRSGARFLVRFLRATSPFVSLTGDVEWVDAATARASDARRQVGHADILAAMTAGDGELAGRLLQERVRRNGERAAARAEQNQRTLESGDRVEPTLV